MDGVTASPRKRGGLLRVWLSTIFVAAMVAPAVGVSATAACAQEEAGGNVGVVIDFPEGAEDQEFCVEIDADQGGSIDGVRALQSTGIDVVTKDFGGDLGVGVCKIGDLGDDDCSFSSGFWAYFTGSAGGDWEFSQTGAVQTEREPGDVDGWVWTPTGQEESEPPSEEPDLDAICLAASPSPEAAEEEAGGIPATTWLVVAGVVLVLVVAFLLLRGRGTAA